MLYYYIFVKKNDVAIAQGQTDLNQKAFDHLTLGEGINIHLTYLTLLLKY